jgi:hypothetical protein
MVFDLELPLDRAAEGYRAMDERRATKVLLQPDVASIGRWPTALAGLGAYRSVHRQAPASGA